MKMKRRILLAVLSLFVGWGGASMAQANVTFETTDNPGNWFDCSASTGSPVLGCVPGAFAGVGSGKSLAVIGLGESITFQSTGQANTLHTVVSLMYPHPTNVNPVMPFDDDLLPKTGKTTVTPQDSGLHVFFCDIHPYMFAAVIVVDTVKNPAVFPLDLGKTLDLHKIVADTLPNVPTASDLVLRLVHTFFIITNPDNWQQYTTQDKLWTPAYPSVPVVAYVGGVTAATLNLDETLRGYFGGRRSDSGKSDRTLSQNAIAPRSTGDPRRGAGLGGHSVRNDVSKEKTRHSDSREHDELES